MDDAAKVVDGLLYRLADTRDQLARAERAEHPDITDKFGRVWVWISHDTYGHDGLLAFPREWIEDGSLGLPSEDLRDNPNYGGLCAVCRNGRW